MEYLSTSTPMLILAGLLLFIALAWLIVHVMKPKASDYSPLYLDTLTGLPNEQQFLLDSQGDSHHASAALMLIELNAFNDINVIFGHEIGHQTLLKTARLLQEICAGQGRLYKLSQGEYLVVCQNNQRNNVVHLIGKIIYFISNENYHIDDHATLLTVTAGIALDVGPDEQALTYARLAKEEARRHRKDWVIYKKELNLEKSHQENLYILSMVQKALRAKEVMPYYQPILDLHSNRITGCEALVRMRDENGNLHAPGVFLNVVKRSNLYRQLTLAMIHTVLSDISSTGLTVSLNLDAIDIKDEGIVSALIDGVQTYGMAGRVIIELTESEYVSDLDKVKEVVATLKSAGIRLAIDDFGVGYSNFEYVAQFAIDYLKIDGRIIQKFQQDRASHAMVKAIASFALALDIPLVAEHVTREEEVKELKRLNFRYLQCYFIGEPMPFEELAGLFDSNSSRLTEALPLA